MKKILCFLLCIVMVSGLFGCGRNYDHYAPTGDGLTWEEGETHPTQEGKEESSQELNLIYYPDRSMNPYVCTDYTNRALFSLLYQSLFVVDRNYQVEPMLCKNFKISQDMRTYTFYPEAAVFSDGSVLTSQDVLQSLLAAKESPYYAGRFTHVKEISVAADGGVVVQLDTDYENFQLLLDIPILKQSQIQLDYPLGTGPYVLEMSGDTACLRRRADWWCKADMVITAPVIGLKRAESNTQIRDEFEFSDLDLVCADPGSDRYADYRCDYELWDCENNIFLYLCCNMNSQVFSNPEVRSALVYAVDRDTLAAEYYRGFARSSNLPASSLSPYYNPTLAARYAYDGGVKLKEAVSQIALPEEPIIFLVNKEDSLRVRVARKIAEVLRSAGLTVQMEEVGASTYQLYLNRGIYDLYLGQTKLSANMDLSPFFSSSGSLNYGSIADVALYTLCNEALANHGNFYTLHQSVMEDGRLCPILMRSYAVYATRGLLTGLTPARDSVFYYSIGKTLAKAQIFD